MAEHEHKHKLIAADQEDIKLAFDEFMETFQEFKRTNNEKIELCKNEAMPMF